MNKLKLKTGGWYYEYNENGQVTCITNIDLFGVEIKYYFEYDNKGRLIKKSNNKSVSQETITYEYDEYDRVIREVESKIGYPDIEVIYQYKNDIITKILKHNLYTIIKKSDSRGNIVYNETIYKPVEGIHRPYGSVCEIYDFDYDNNTFIQTVIRKTDGNNVIEMSKKKYSCNNNEIKLIEIINN
jgi:YD repeat-containing protein